MKRETWYTIKWIFHFNYWVWKCNGTVKWEVILSLIVLVVVAGNHLLTPSTCWCSALVMSDLDVVNFHWIQYFYKCVITIMLPLSLCTTTEIGSSPMVLHPIAKKSLDIEVFFVVLSHTFCLFFLLFACSVFRESVTSLKYLNNY